MNDLKNVRGEWSTAERIAFWIREKYPQLFDEALYEIVREDIQIKNDKVNDII